MLVFIAGDDLQTDLAEGIFKFSYAGQDVLYKAMPQSCASV